MLAIELKYGPSFTATGTYVGYDSVNEQVPIDIYANAPNQLTTVVHTQSGDTSPHSKAQGTINRTLYGNRLPGR